ncbi:hypothetical protein B484DRAFT_396894, partial [Ochromonadaceae sp. CCMP2298]
VASVLRPATLSAPVSAPHAASAAAPLFTPASASDEGDAMEVGDDVEVVQRAAASDSSSGNSSSGGSSISIEACTATASSAPLFVDLTGGGDSDGEQEQRRVLWATLNAIVDAADANDHEEEDDL